jgi:hypothetical protein
VGPPWLPHGDLGTPPTPTRWIPGNQARCSVAAATCAPTPSCLGPQRRGQRPQAGGGFMNAICAAKSHCFNCRSREKGKAAREHLAKHQPEALNPNGDCAFGVPWDVKKGWAKPVELTVRGKWPTAPGFGERGRRASSAIGDEWQERGPLMWGELHTQQSPNAAWLRGFSSRIPCGSCGAHWRKLLEDRPAVYEPISAWRRWSVDAHNAVNERLDKPLVSYAEAADKWGFDLTAKMPSRQEGVDLETFFDRVVVINLDRRTDRWARVSEALSGVAWPFREPVRFSASDGRAGALPPAWRQAGPGAYGCMLSHRRVLASAIADGVEKLLVLEDDVCFVAGFAENVRTFLANVPAEWDGLMFGGQHMMTPRAISPGVVRCMNGQRTHAYAIRGRWMRDLLAAWEKFVGHCDHKMGQMEPHYRVFAPSPWLAGQDSGRSDITGRGEALRFW